MWLRAAAVADVGRINGANQAFYRIHPGSMQRTTYAGHLIDLEGRRAAFDSVLRSTDHPLPDGDACTSRPCAPWPSTPSTELAPIMTRVHGPRVGPGSHGLRLPVWPEAPSSREWKALQRRLRRPRARRPPCRSPVRRIARDLNGRVRWRRWRRSGV